MTERKQAKVLITGFGPFLDILTNPAWEVSRRLPPTLTTPTSSTTTRLIVPDFPIPAKYHDILTTTPALIKEHNPDIVVHIGLAHGRTWFAVEKGAQKEGYHEVLDMGRKVFTRAENKKLWGKEVGRLESTLELEVAVEAWSEEVRGVGLPPRDSSSGPGVGGEAKERGKKGKQKTKEAADSYSNAKGKSAREQVDVRLSDDVGNYVCGFMYYVSLLEMQRSTGRMDTVFFHVPYLESEEEVLVGVRVAEALIRALVGVWEES
ncbi:peptidase C15, pyroglutamyl peptidase I-like protein [Melanomma pulvis-pyrius CBS 109.77]|uniref:Peptidase C15, pyroglutamyl peptidase I-like protein n=1 Tax=Melanomma pulvis-pyrius CBS 109.77 TaxID=1314802 RepID=A0A6A6WVK0_9PLEO|nr:peptidase C15, pyroglutamyl peptidase I-like protein [Melanomma pulvis-pyrius CBS 109.77]